jgi:prepilin-type N-terminal cleavage/methylation domain-containing protein
MNAQHYRRCRPVGRRNGFTLVELLVTVSIIAVLMSIMLPSLRSARAGAKRVVCSSNIRQIGVGLWNYWTENNGTVPCIISPMTNGGAMSEGGPARGFGDPSVPDEDLDPFDIQRWPQSLPNVLMPTHLGTNPNVFVCPAAIVGWPRNGSRFRYTYRPAAANQPNGVPSPEQSYFRENFGFMDGRMLRTLRVVLTGNVIENAQLLAQKRSTYLRDLVRREPTFKGPHLGGINVLDRGLAVEFRTRDRAAEDLASFGSGVMF